MLYLLRTCVIVSNMIGLRSSIALTLVIALTLTSYARSALYRDKITLLTDVVAKSPNKARAHSNLGDALAVQDRRLDAIRHFLFAIQLDPNFASAYYNLGVMLLKEERTDEAIEHYRIAIQLNPNNADYHYNIGVALERKGQLDDAIFHIQRSLALKPEHELAYWGLRILMDKKEYAEGRRVESKHGK